tara:strand:+ start:278 stop:466 length:189 start_codon:yes stop_codon:yes gene_type:complete
VYHFHRRYLVVDLLVEHYLCCLEKFLLASRFQNHRQIHRFYQYQSGQMEQALLRHRHRLQML